MHSQERKISEDEEDSRGCRSSDSDAKENNRVLIETPQKKKLRENCVGPLGDDDELYCREVSENQENTRFESSHYSNSDSDGIYCTSSNDDLASSEDGESEVSESDHGDADDSQESSAEIPLYEGSTLTSAIFKKHRTSEAAKEDLLKFLELTLPADSSVATSSYRFNKRHTACLLPYELKELSPKCHQKLENEVCRNSECDQEGVKVDPIRFYVVPLKPQIQRLLRGKVSIKYPSSIC